AITDVTPGPAPGSVWLRPAVAGDAGLSTALAGADSLGSESPNPSSWLDHLTDPSCRTWVAMVDGAPCGRLTVTVRSGTGMLTGAVPPHRRSESLSLLKRVLGSDFQIRELLITDPGHVSLVEDGFERVVDGWRWWRSYS